MNDDFDYVNLVPTLGNYLSALASATSKLGWSPGLRKPFAAAQKASIVLGA